MLAEIGHKIAMTEPVLVRWGTFYFKNVKSLLLKNAKQNLERGSAGTQSLDREKMFK